MRRSVVVKAGTEIPAEPLSLAETKLHLRVDSDVTDSDTLISALIQAAREWCENHTRRSFVRRTLELRMDCFPDEIRLPRGPVASVTAVKYTVATEADTTLAASAYQTDLYGTPPRILPVFGGTWPVPKSGTLNAVLVEYEAGYDPSDDSPTDYGANIPQAIKAAMKLLVGHWYENRESVVLSNVQAIQVPMAVISLLAPFEIRDFTLEG